MLNCSGLFLQHRYDRSLFVYFTYVISYVSLDRELSRLRPENIFGFLVNRPSGFLWPFRGKHWIAIRRISDTYYDLDSKHSEPVMIGKSSSDVLTFLADRLKGDGTDDDKNTELLLVLTADIFQAGSWNSDPDTSSPEPSGNS